MEDFWTVLTNKAENIASHWASYTILGSFVLYVLGYLALRFHLTALGVGTDLSVLDERYLFTGMLFLIYLISSLPILLMLIFLLVAPIYLPYQVLPLSFRVKLAGFFYSQWQRILSWSLLPNRLALFGIILALLIIQLVMRQCFLLNDMLLAEDLPDMPRWLRHLLLAQTEGPMALYFSGILAGVLVSAIILYVLRNRLNQTIGSQILVSLLGFLLCVQLLLIPVNYGVLVLGKSMPRVTGLDAPGTLKPNEQAWLVWEGNDGKTFLLWKQQANIYKKSLITLPRTDVQRVEISGYDPIFKFLFSEITAKPNG